MTRSDEQLLEAVRAGDRGARDELVRRHAASVHKFAVKLCREPEDARDVSQETLLGAARGLDQFRGESSLTTWFYALARSFCIKKRRSSKFAPRETLSLERTSEVENVADPAASPDEAAARLELAATLERAIAALQPAQREVLVLRDVEGLAAAEVAEIVGVSVAAVKSRLHRARADVKREVQRLMDGRSGE